MSGNKKYLIENKKLMSQWHWEKNNESGLNPEKLTYGSNKKAWWVCEKGHEWEAIIKSRNNGNHCPYCSNKKILKGYNDLATIRPDLAKEWNFKKNKLSPNEIAVGSNKKVWWKCEKGHEWFVSPHSRTSNKTRGKTECPYCSKEIFTSFPEQAIFFYCKKVTDTENRYKKFGREIDVYLPEYNIGIEYNGSYWHKNRKQCDDDKVKYFADKGIRIITVKESDKNFVRGDVIEYIYHQTDKTSLGFAIEEIFRLIGIQCDTLNVNDDVIEIWNQYIEMEKENSVALKEPKSVIEWHYEKNGKLTPAMIPYASNKKVWWKCKECGYEWKAKAANYARGHGCPKCAAKARSIKNGTAIRCVETSAVYDSIAEASRITGIKNIKEALKYNNKTAKGYHWEYIDKPKQSKCNKPVRCVETGIIYTSMTEAGEKIGISRSRISLACNGKRKTAGGYHWEFVNES